MPQVPDTTFAAVVKCVSSQLEIDPNLIKADAKLVDDLGANSLMMVEIIMALEDELGIELPDEVGLAAETVNDIVTLTRRFA